MKMLLVVKLRQLLFLQLTVLGAFGQQGWSVKYKHSNICALKGSSVSIHSNYTHPSGLRGVKKFWAKNPSKSVEPSDLTVVKGYSGRVQYFEDENQTFSLHLQTVNKSDEHMYCVRITNEKAEKYLGYPGVMLRVTELRVEVPERVSEGNATLLTCATTCNLTEKATFIWFKNGRLLEKNSQDLNTLYIQSTRIDDAGSYCCAVQGYEHRCSPEVFLNVRYPPKSVSVSISPSGGIVEGSSVNLTCSSDGYPPVENYTWFKVKAMVGQGSTFTISKFSSEDSGEYKCKCINAEGVRYSVAVTLKVVGGLSKGHQGHRAVIGVLIFSAVLSFAVVLVLLWWKKKFCWSEDQTLKQDNMYSNVSVQTPDKNAPQPETSSHGQDDYQYAIIEHQSAKCSPVKASISRADEKTQYSMVQHCGDKPVNNTQEEDVQYATVTFNQSNRPAETVKNDSVIYSIVK